MVKKSMETAKYDHPIAKRLAVQINCKVGGTPWSVEVPLRLGMIVGIDICVDSRNRSISYASVVASYNKDYSKFFSTSFEFRTKDHEQLSTGLCEHVAKAIHRFKTFQNHFPAVIVIYRDGVSNKVLPHVIFREMPLMKVGITSKSIFISFIFVCLKLSIFSITHEIGEIKY
jgi:aubergine